VLALELLEDLLTRRQIDSSICGHPAAGAGQHQALPVSAVELELSENGIVTIEPEIKVQFYRKLSGST
jgi:hypothetical protein